MNKNLCEYGPWSDDTMNIINLFAIFWGRYWTNIVTLNIVSDTTTDNVTVTFPPAGKNPIVLLFENFFFL